MIQTGATPEHSSDQPGQPIERGPTRPPEEVAAENAARMDQVNQTYGEAMALDGRAKEIGDELMAMFIKDEAKAAPLQPLIDGGQFPEQAAILLAQYEREQRAGNPDFDVTTMDTRRMAFMLTKQLQEASTSVVAEESELDAQSTENSRDDYEEIWEQLNADPDFQNSDNIGKLQTLVAAPQIPEAYRVRYKALLTIQEVATNPEDQVIITERINAIDLSAGAPSTALFIETEVLANENLSDEFRASVAELYNIPNPHVRTGGQVGDALAARNENGEHRYTPDNPIDLGGGTAGYVYPNGDRAIRVTVHGRGSREIPLNANDRDETIGLKISLAKIWSRNEWDGQTDFFGEGIDIETQILFQTDPHKLAKVQSVMNVLLGSGRGFDALIVQDNEADFIGWFNQFTATKGDAMQGDFDIDLAVENRTNLGFHPNGDHTQIDYEVLRAAANYAKGQYGSGVPDYFALQKHLHQLFPDRVPLTGKNQANDGL